MRAEDMLIRMQARAGTSSVNSSGAAANEKSVSKAEVARLKAEKQKAALERLKNPSKRKVDLSPP